MPQHTSFPLVEPDTGLTIGTSTMGQSPCYRGTRSPTASPLGLPRAADDDVVEPPASPILAGVRYADTEPGHREPRWRVAAWRTGVGGAAAASAGHDPPVVHRPRLQRRRRPRPSGQSWIGFAGPLVVTGDVNAPLHAPELSALADGLVDAFAGGRDRARRSGAHHLATGTSIDQVLVRV